MSSARTHADRTFRQHQTAYAFRPSWPLELLLLAVLACALRAMAWGGSEISYDPDESVYVVIAQQLLAGNLPYLTVWDQHPVGLPALLAGLGWLAGDILLAGRIAGSLAVAGTAWLVLRLVAQATGGRAAAAVAAVLYILGMTRFEALPAQTEVFNNALVAGAMFLLFRARRWRGRAELAALAGAGLALGLGLQIKYVVFPECVLLCGCYLAMRAGDAGWRLAPRAAAMILAGLAPTALVGGLYLATGHWDAFWQANFSANVAYAQEVEPLGNLAVMIWNALRPSGVILLVAGVAVLAGLRGARARRDRLEIWLACWLLAVVLDICLPMKFWSHYFLALLPPVCIACGLALGRLRGRAGMAVLAALLLLQPARITAIQLLQLRDNGRTDASRLIAADIARRGEGRLYVYNDVPLLYYLTARTPPLRYILPSELSEFATSSGARAQAEVAAVLAGRPRYIVTSDPPRFEFPPAIDAMMQAALAGYDMVASYPNPVADGSLLLHVLR